MKKINNSPEVCSNRADLLKSSINKNISNQIKGNVDIGEDLMKDRRFFTAGDYEKISLDFFKSLEEILSNKQIQENLDAYLTRVKSTAAFKEQNDLLIPHQEHFINKMFYKNGGKEISLAIEPLVWIFKKAVAARVDLAKPTTDLEDDLQSWERSRLRVA